jgi:hypothetical protein
MSRLRFLIPASVLVASCGGGEDASSTPSPPLGVAGDGSATDTGAPGEAATETSADGGGGQGADAKPDAPGDVATAPDSYDAKPPKDSAADQEAGPSSCGFHYDTMFPPMPPPPVLGAAPPSAVASLLPSPGSGPDAIAHADPPPAGVELVHVPRPGPGPGHVSIVMPQYDDDMPLFERGAAWKSPTRCYETPNGVQLLTEPEAFDLYASIAAETTGIAFPTTAGRRSVVGVRGAYPGTFAWHGNKPDRFNDTLVLLWAESGGTKHVREFPVNTDTGAKDFGPDASSSLRPNRRYRYVNGWHNTYNALHIDETGYRVRDDTNKNGHWDSDRNGWLPPAGAPDHDRTGSGHNIHMGSVDAPLGTAKVDGWSAGCQVIPGMANWKELIGSAWTQEGDPVSYFLVDARDIAPRVWSPCTPDGSHACPLRVQSFPYADSRDTSQTGWSAFKVYNCSSADESGPEIVYELHVDKVGTLSVSVDCQAPIDVDVHLLEGDDAKACLARADKSFTYDLSPGRYLVVADTYVSGGQQLAGAYTLHIDFK